MHFFLLNQVNRELTIFFSLCIQGRRMTCKIILRSHSNCKFVHLDWINFLGQIPSKIKEMP